MSYSGASTHVDVATFSFAARFTFYGWLGPSKRELVLEILLFNGAARFTAK